MSLKYFVFIGFSKMHEFKCIFKCRIFAADNTTVNKVKPKHKHDYIIGADHGE